MPERPLFRQWPAANDTTKYPFSDRATLINDDGRLLLESLFVDAALYPGAGAGATGLYLSAVTVDHEEVILTVGDSAARGLASGSFPVVNPTSRVITLKDSLGRPAGVLVSVSPERLALFQSWGVGEFEFTPAQSEFCATVCFPTPAIRLEGILLPDGTLLTGEVWLVGEDGIVLRAQNVITPEGTTVQALRVDAVGDPLFRRRLCTPNNLFPSPRFIRAVRVVGPNTTFECDISAGGGFQILIGSRLASDSVLRLVNTEAGMLIEAVGEPDG